jgi:hypothetical protein
MWTFETNMLFGAYDNVAMYGLLAFQIFLRKAFLNLTSI